MGADKDLDFATITPSQTSLPHGADPDSVSVIVELNGKVLSEGNEYSITKKKESDPSSGIESLVITVTGTNGYTGERIIRIPYEKADKPSIRAVPPTITTVFASPASKCSLEISIAV